MADSKVQDLVKRTLSSLAELTGVRLWSGKTGESDALGVEMSELLSSAQVTAADNPDYLCLTPKGFRNSQMSETERGVGIWAADSDIQTKTGNLLLRSGKQEVMQAQWHVDWFIRNAGASVKPIYEANAEGADMYAMTFNANFRITNFPTGSDYYFSPELPTGKQFKSIYFSIIARSSSLFGVSTKGITYSGGRIETNLGSSSNMNLGISADGRNIFFNTLAASPDDYIISCRMNVILQ